MIKYTFDDEFKKKYKDNIYIDYGIKYGSNIILVIKAGQDGSLYGYNDKYIRLANYINKKYGCTVICSSNPFDKTNSLDNLFDVIDSLNISNYKVYYLGFSNGGIIGAWYGVDYNKIERMALVNPPLMYNLFKTKDGLKRFNKDIINLVYGSLDQSIKYTELLQNILSDKIKLNIIPNEDHHISNRVEDFYTIPEKYLLYDVEIIDKDIIF